MGRSKPAPKRRRVEDEAAEKDAIEALLQAPQEQVEAAAASATRSSCEHWPTVDDETEDLPDWLSGLGRSMTLPAASFQSLQALHETIKTQASGVWASWSGSKDDPRKRAFGFLPKTLGYDPKVRARLDISTPWKQNDDDGREERTRNHQAMVLLDELSEGVKEAIDYLCQEFSKSIPASVSPCVKEYLQFSNLVAVQPNLHCGRELLPTHMDHPQKDGFGVVIVTISMIGDGRIILQDYTNSQKRTMKVSQGQAYMLSGMARDACAHGVLASAGHDRESLNLRFGLHDLEQPDGGLPLIQAKDVLKYW